MKSDDGYGIKKKPGGSRISIGGGRKTITSGPKAPKKPTTNKLLVKEAADKFQTEMSLIGSESSLLGLDFGKPSEIMQLLGRTNANAPTKKAITNLASAVGPTFLKRAEQIRQGKVSQGRSQTLLTGRRTLLG